jgi:transcriptional regulator with XRE-family HTH domain
MSDFGSELARLMAARGVGVRELGRQVHYNPGHISNLKNGRARPSPELAWTWMGPSAQMAASRP